ncbi:MAG TPA: hypothetical protein VN653_20690 [Anaerolineales bacterium]|nr:hypothetical protein [Anaerolineales bacterium]
MCKTFSKLFYLLTIGVFFFSSCNMPGNNIAAEITASPEPSTATATQTEVPPTETPTMTATATLTPEPSATFTPEVPKAEVRRETNCRIGPAGNYDLVATYQIGQKLEVVAADLGNGYWFVKNPDKPEEQCYLLGNNITITGDTSALPKFTPQPSPTLAPYFDVKFKKFEACNGENYAIFVVVNTGSTPFKSAYIKLTNPKLNKSVEQALGAFDLHVGCVLAKDIWPLDPGGTGYVNSPVITWPPRGNKLLVVIMLCTEKNLKGACPIQNIELKQ